MVVRGLAHAGAGSSEGAEVAFLEFYDAVGLFVEVWERSGDCGGHCIASMSVRILIGGKGIRGNENARSKHSARGSKIKLVSIQSVGTPSVPAASGVGPVLSPGGLVGMHA